jgi:hypothetical protein
MRRELLDIRKNLFLAGTRFKRSNCGHLFLAPQPIGKRPDHLAHVFTDRQGFWPVLSQNAVE